MTAAPPGSSFRWFTATQFLGAFNDNLYKQLLLLLAAKWLFPGEDQQGIAVVMFALPFLLFSGIAGDLSEKLSKRRVIIAMKLCEIGIMALGAIALQTLQWWLLLVVLFLMGTHSAFFGPSKYGVLPEIVPPQRLLHANGIVAMTTFLSILLGTAAAGPLLDGFGGIGDATAPRQLWIPGAIGAGLALVGWLCARRIAPLPATRPDLRLPRQPFGNLFVTMKLMARERHLLTVVLVNSMFWFNGGVLQQAVNGLGAEAFLAVQADENKLLSYLLVTLAASIMLGCVLVPRLAPLLKPSRMVVGGALLMTAGQALLILVGPVLSRAQGGYALAHAALALAGLGAAMFTVPVTTFLQDAPEPGSKGQAFAVNNFCNFASILLSGGFYLLGVRLGAAPAVLAAAAGAMVLLALACDRGWLGECDRRQAELLRLAPA